MKTKQTLRLTAWGKPDELLHSQYGWVPYRAWCDFEVARIRARGGRAVVVERGEECALAKSLCK